MRLLSITLENFLAYRAKITVQLDDIALAVLSGENGAGKSSLLDAITWALWGEARAKTDDELLHTGQSAMTVSVEFWHEQTRYRVTRKHELKKGKKLLFDRLMDSQWEPLGDGAVKSTQATITRLLKLNFNTFVNSAFLQQGKADSLMLQPPRDRKDLLVEILDLTRWSRYEKAAKKHRDDLEKDLNRIADQIAGHDRELAAEPRLKDELYEAQARFIDMDRAYQAIDDTHRQLQSVADKLKNTNEQSAALQQQIKRSKDDLAACDRLLLGYMKTQQTYAPLIESAAEIETRYSELQQLKLRSEQLDTAREQYLRLDGQLKAERKGLETDIANAQKQLSALKRNLPADNLPEQLVAIDQQIEVLEQSKVERAALVERIATLDREYSTLTADNAAIHKQADLLKERLNLLELSEDVLCPICRQPLDEVHKVEVISEFETERDDLRAEYKTKQSRLKQIEQDGQRDQQLVEAFDRRLISLPTLHKQQATLTAQLGQAQTVQRDVTQATSRLNDLQARLAAEDYGQEFRDRLAALAYDPTQHDHIKAERKAREVYTEWYLKLADAREKLPALEADLNATESRRLELIARLEDDQARLEVCRDQIGELQEAIRYQDRIEAEWKQARKTKDDALFNQQYAQQKINALPEIARQRAEALARQNHMFEERDDYQQLIDACGRNGVVLLIIDSALETLNEATNRLLSRLTDNQLHVDFTTQSMTRSGDLFDTLDIIINDGDMSRAYELYSGGEGFRINFAVRVALSQMLARRAGTQLQTLVIDEGFGSQDSAGREKLVEAINAIRSQFDLILVVTHIDELREVFPVQIRVTKGANGSSVQITGYDYATN